MIRVWLDDMAIRDPSPELGWVVARTADEAIALLQTGTVGTISLDHDLGDFRQEPYPREVTGMDVVRWMLENKVFPRVISIHSHSPKAVAMADALKEAPPEVLLVRRPFRVNTHQILEAICERKGL